MQASGPEQLGSPPHLGTVFLGTERLPAASPPAAHTAWSAILSGALAMSPWPLPASRDPWEGRMQGLWSDSSFTSVDSKSPLKTIWLSQLLEGKAGSPGQLLRCTGLTPPAGSGVPGPSAANGPTSLGLPRPGAGIGQGIHL